jgi:hypothetical protein
MKKIKFVPFLLAGMFLSAVNANAQYTATQPGLNVAFSGKINNLPVFKVDYVKTCTDDYFLSISDAQGYVFYEETLKQTSYTKKFMIDIPEAEGVDLVVTVTDRKGKEKRTFHINSRQSHVNDLVVTKN